VLQKLFKKLTGSFLAHPVYNW